MRAGNRLVSVVDRHGCRVELSRTPQEQAALLCAIYEAWVQAPGRPPWSGRRLVRARRRALTALLLRTVHGWSISEISEVLGVRRRAVQLMLRRAREGLRVACGG